MITETGQILSTVHRLLDGHEMSVDLIRKKDGKHVKKNVWILTDERNDLLYAVTHPNHPSTIWARQSVENYNWLVEHLHALGSEYTYRYGRTHATIEKLGYIIQSPPFNLKEWDWTTPACAMKPEYIISDDPIVNYRNYYREGKKHIHKWKNRDMPEWING